MPISWMEAPEPYHNGQTFDALTFRYEKYDENNQRDSRLFRVTEVEDILGIENILNYNRGRPTIG